MLFAYNCEVPKSIGLDIAEEKCRRGTDPRQAFQEMAADCIGLAQMDILPHSYLNDVPGAITRGQLSTNQIDELTQQVANDLTLANTDISLNAWGILMRARIDRAFEDHNQRTRDQFARVLGSPTPSAE